MSNKKKRLGLSIFIILIIVLISVILACTTINKKIEKTPKTEISYLKTNINTSNWVFYRNNENKFEIKYPKYWEMEEISMVPGSSSDGTPLFSMKSKSGATISILPKGGYDRGTPFHQAIRKDVNINGHNAVKLDYGVIGNGERFIVIGLKDWFSENRIELQAKPHEGTNNQLEEMNAIIATFDLI